MSDVPATITEALVAALGDRARPDEPLARHTSLRVGGPADLLVTPETDDELALIVRTASSAGVRVTVLGGGSNVLVGDGGVRGIVVKLGDGFRRIEWTSVEGGAQVRAGAAVQVGRLARDAVDRGLAGLEYAEGIPGTVGGALFMNAGAYGGELSATVDAAWGVTAAGETSMLDAATLGFRYRQTELPAGFIVTAVGFRLRAEEPAAVRARMAAVRDRRLASQPQGNPSAGSVFKNPEGDHAGRLIEVAGLKGTRVGRAKISEQHANFIVNEGGASAGDVKALIDLAQRVVWERSGVWLEPEVRLVGRW